VALYLLDTITLLHPYNGHILGIFLNVHVILLGQRECATAQTGPYFQTVLFGHLGEGHGTHLITPRPDGCVARSSRIIVLPPEDQRRWMSSTFAPGVGFNAYAVWSSRTFGVRFEDGVPNSSPSEPRPDLREGRGFDPVGAVSAQSATLRAGRRDGVRRSTVRVTLQKMLYFRRGSKDFRIKPLVCAQIIELKFLAGNFLFGSWL